MTSGGSYPLIANEKEAKIVDTRIVINENS